MKNKEGISVVQKRRSFGGKTENFKDKEEKVFYQRMLKAYLKGHKFFLFGVDRISTDILGRRIVEKKEHPVLENWN